MRPRAAAAALLAAVAGYASPLEDVMLSADQPGPSPARRSPRGLAATASTSFGPESARSPHSLASNERSPCLRSLDSIPWLVSRLLKLHDSGEASPGALVGLYWYASVECTPDTVAVLANVTCEILTADVVPRLHSDTPTEPDALSCQLAVCALRLLHLHLLALRRSRLDHPSAPLLRLRKPLAAVIAAHMAGSNGHAARLMHALQAEAVAVMLSGSRAFFDDATERVFLSRALLALLHDRITSTTTVPPSNEPADEPGPPAAAERFGDATPVMLLAQGLLRLFSSCPCVSKLMTPFRSDDAAHLALPTDEFTSDVVETLVPLSSIERGRDAATHVSGSVRALLTYIVRGDGCVSKREQLGSKLAEWQQAGASPERERPAALVKSIDSLTAECTAETLAEIAQVHARVVLADGIAPDGSEACVGVLAAVVQELCARAALDSSLADATSASLCGIIEKLVHAAAAVLEAPAEEGSLETALLLTEQTLSTTFLSRVLCFALDAAYQMPIQQLQWAKRLVPCVLRLANTKTMLSVSSRGAQSLQRMQTRGHSSTARSLSHSFASLDGTVCSSRQSAASDVPRHETATLTPDGSGVGIDGSSALLYSTSLVESSHPLPVKPEAFVHTISIPGATHLCIKFDPRCATYPSDVLRVQLPAPPLPEGWTLEGEIAQFAGAPPVDGTFAAGEDASSLEHQARRDEFQGLFRSAYELFLAAYALSKDPSLLLQAARIKLRQLGDPHTASALLEGVMSVAPPAPVDGRLDVAASAKYILADSRKAAAAGAGRVIEFAGGPMHWPRRPIVLPGAECTIVLAPEDEWPQSWPECMPLSTAVVPVAPEEVEATPGLVGGSSMIASAAGAAATVGKTATVGETAAAGRKDEQDGNDSEEEALQALIVSMGVSTDSATTSAAAAKSEAAAPSGASTDAAMPSDARSPPVVVGELSKEMPAELSSTSFVNEPTSITSSAASRAGSLLTRGRIPAGALWGRVRQLLPTIIEVSKRRMQRANRPRWGVKLEVRAWEPPREQKVDAPSQQLCHAVGLLLCQQAATLSAGEPLSPLEGEVEKQAEDWLSSPLFSGGLASMRLHKSHPLHALTNTDRPAGSGSAAYSVGYEESSTMPALAVANPAAADGIHEDVRAFLDTSNSQGAKVDAQMKAYAGSSASTLGSDVPRRMMVGWLLVHTGTIHEAIGLEAMLDEAGDDFLEQPSGRQSTIKETCAYLEPVWNAAAGLAREVEDVYLSTSAQPSEGQRKVLQFAHVLSLTSPQAALPRANLPTAAQLEEMCTSLCESAFSYLLSCRARGSETSEITTVLAMHQTRALSRASGMRLTARILQIYAAQPLIISSLLQVIHRAQERLGPSPPALTEPSQPHFLLSTQCCGVVPRAHLRAAFTANLEELTALIEKPASPEEDGASSPSRASSPKRPSIRSDGLGAKRADEERECRLLALRLLHMPLIAEDRHLLSASPLMRWLRINGRGTDGEAHCCRLLWNVLASMCMQKDVTASDASNGPRTAANVATESPEDSRSPTSVGRGNGSGAELHPVSISRHPSAADSAPWVNLLNQLCEALAVRLQGCAIRTRGASSGETSVADPGSAAYDSSHDPHDPLSPVHYSDDASMDQMEREAAAEDGLREAEQLRALGEEVADMAATRGEGPGEAGADGANADRSVGVADDESTAVADARDRVKSEEACISMLGLLVYACAENNELVQALASPPWTRVLFAAWHFASPRCTRLSMRLLSKVLPLCRPDDMRVPGPEHVANLGRAFHLDKSQGEAPIPFLFAVAGKEISGHGHHLAFGRTVWRPVTAWQPIIDGTISLIRRLLSTQAWRQPLLEAMCTAITAVPALMSAPSGVPSNDTWNAIHDAVTAFSVLGGHLWCCSPGARVAVASSGGQSGTTITAGSGTVLSGGCGSSHYSVVLEGAAKGWRSPLVVPSARVVARPQVALPPSILRKHLVCSEGVEEPAGWMLGYAALLPEHAASTPAGALLRSRALGSLQWLTEDRKTLKMLFRAQLFPFFVASAVRPSPLESAISRDALAKQLIEIEYAAKELQACRRPPEALDDQPASVSPFMVQRLLKARGVVHHGPTTTWHSDRADQPDWPEVISTAHALLDGRSHNAAIAACMALAADTRLSSQVDGLFQVQDSDVGSRGPSVAPEIPVPPPTQPTPRRSVTIRRSPSWTTAFEIKDAVAEMGFNEFTVGACHAAVTSIQPGPLSEEDRKQAAVMWLLEHIGMEISGAEDLPGSSEEEEEDLDVSDPFAAAAERSERSQWAWLSNSARPRPPPPQQPTGDVQQSSTQQPQFQTLAVTRPLTGNSVLPGRDIIVADPNNNRFRARVPAGVQPGQTFHVRVPLPQTTAPVPPPPPPPAASSTAGDEITEFLPLGAEKNCDANTGVPGAEASSGEPTPWLNRHPGTGIED